MTAKEHLQLVEASLEYLEQFLALAGEYAERGDDWERIRYREALRDAPAHIRRLRDHARGVNLPPGWVPHSTYWLVRDGRTIVAASDLRHELTEHLEYEDGHIGYGTRPSERGKGYGTAVCALTLRKARGLGLKRVLITCDADNLPSARIIEKNGGKFENQVVSRETGKLKNRYWVELSPAQDEAAPASTGSPSVAGRATLPAKDADTSALTPKAAQCPVCLADAVAAEPVHQRRRDVLLRCGACGSLFAEPRPGPEELAELYRREYYGPAAAERQPRWAEQQRSAGLHRTVLRVLRKRYPHVVLPGARVLDFGAGLGYFLAEAGKGGLKGLGVEFNDFAAAHARDKLHLDVRTGDEAALADLPEESFELVTCFEVLEHLLLPREVLSALAGKLVPGGVLAASFPNLRCWRYRLEGGSWFNVANPTHLNFFTMRGLREMLAAAGLVKPRRAVFYGGRPGFGPVRNFLQYFVRLANVGSDVRVFAEKPRR